MDLKTARRNLWLLDQMKDDVIELRDAEEGAAMKGDVDELLLPIARIRKSMVERLSVLEEHAGATA